MEFKAAKCPSCGGDLQLPTDKERVKCMYCGNDVVIKQAIAASSGINPSSVRELALAAYQSKNYESSLQKWDQILSVDSNNAEAWLYRGLAVLQMSELLSLWNPDVFKLVSEKVGIKEADIRDILTNQQKEPEEAEVVTLFKGTTVYSLEARMLTMYRRTAQVEIVGTEGDSLIVMDSEKCSYIVNKKELL